MITLYCYINLPCTRITSVCFTEQLTASEGLARKLCNVSNCFQAIIPPSSLTQLPVTLADKRPTMESYFVCTQTSYTRTCTRTQAGKHARTKTLPGIGTMVLRVARCRGTVRVDRVAGLVQHQCLHRR